MKLMDSIHKVSIFLRVFIRNTVPMILCLLLFIGFLGIKFAGDFYFKWTKEVIRTNNSTDYMLIGR